MLLFAWISRFHTCPLLRGTLLLSQGSPYTRPGKGSSPHPVGSLVQKIVALRAHRLLVVFPPPPPPALATSRVVPMSRVVDTRNIDGGDDSNLSRCVRGYLPYRPRPAFRVIKIKWPSLLIGDTLTQPHIIGQVANPADALLIRSRCIVGT